MSRNLPKPLVWTNIDQSQVSDGHQSFSIEGGVIRFVEKDPYAASFGLQWNKYRQTQLDSHTGTTITEDRLTRLAGGNLDIFKDKYVLEVGCGAGRFTEIMLHAGANLFSIDLSDAVDACYTNFGQHQDLVVAQGNILDLPLDNNQFDIVFCVGVVQHTPDPEATMTALCDYVKPGGLLIMDHYTYGYPINWSRRVLRSVLLNRSPQFSLKFTRAVVTLLYPLHRLLRRATYTRFHKITRPMYHRWVQFSPVVDYQNIYPELGHPLLREWAVLDTHDTLTDTYKHLRTVEEIKDHLRTCDMTDIQVDLGGNGVEARAKKAER